MHLLLNSMVLCLNLTQLTGSRVNHLLKFLELGLVLRVQRRHLQGLEPRIIRFKLLLKTCDIHCTLLLTEVVLRNFPLCELQSILESTALLPDGPKLGVCLFVSLHQALDLLRAVHAKRGTHATLCHLVPSTAHGTAGINELALKSDHTPARPALKTDASGLLQVLSNKRVLQCEEERNTVLRLRGLDQVDQARCALGSSRSQFHPRCLVANLLETDACCPPKVVSANKLDHCLGILGGVHHNRVEH
mmetsp:Transcript_100675/g.293403  ORF Transcript_100675/g.293403 Transcript_100675/m.293403 type:complete len:247 (-) Transcript_100675:1509-2249(-)